MNAEFMKMLEDEKQALRADNERLKTRLARAETALMFYGKPTSYAVIKREKTVYQAELVGDSELADNGKNTYVAGVRARMHFKLVENENPLS